MKIHPNKFRFHRTHSQGFTILELLIVIAIMTILSTVFVIRTTGISEKARDTEREEDIANIGRHLEEAYSTKKLGTPSYPDTSQIMGSTVFTGADPDILKAPKSSVSSIVVATNSNTTVAGITPSPSTSQYVYQPLTSSGVLCTSSLVCVKYNLYYRSEISNSVIQKKSFHQQ